MKRAKPYIMEPVASYGFRWGPLVVARQCSAPKLGYILAVQTDHGEIEIRVSPSGRRIQVFRSRNGELTPMIENGSRTTRRITRR